MPQHAGVLDFVAIESLGLAIDSNSFVPYYMQIVDHVREMVKKNKLKQGQTFCSEGEIAQALGISKMPVRQAFQKLRSEGLLVIAKGKRPVVGSGRVPWNFQQLRGFSEEMRRRGLNPSARLLSMSLEDPDLEVAQALKLTPGERVYRARRLRFVDIAPGVVATFVGAIALGEVIGAYLSEFARNYVSTYAGLASVMIALVFLYAMASLFVFGGALNAAILRARGQTPASGPVNPP